MRIDKFIWFVRLAKTRKDAVEMINNSRIRLNSVDLKPSKEITINDWIQVNKHNAVFSYKALQIPDRRLGPKLVADFIEDCTPDEEKVKFREYQNAQKEYRQFGIGKPTKKQRRELNAFKE